jgi:hypothetical protein
LPCLAMELPLRGERPDVATAAGRTDASPLHAARKKLPRRFEAEEDHTVAHGGESWLAVVSVQVIRCGRTPNVRLA